MSSLVLTRQITGAVTHRTSYSGNMNNCWHKNQLVLQYGGQHGWLDNQLEWNFWHFFFAKCSFCLSKTYAKITNIRYLFKSWSVTFDPEDGAKTLTDFVWETIIRSLSHWNRETKHPCYTHLSYIRLFVSLWSMWSFCPLFTEIPKTEVRFQDCVT